MKKILFKNDFSRVDLIENTASTGLVVTFSYYKWGVFKPLGFSEEYWVDKVGFDVVSFQYLRDDWYNEFLEDDFNQIVNGVDLEKYSKVIMYGVSMGGYAALNFANFFKPTHIIAYSPQYSIVESWDNRWANCLDVDHKYQFSGFNYTPAPDVLVVYDPFSKDRLHVDCYKKFINNINCVCLPNAGHHPSSVLSELGLLNKLQLNFINNVDINFLLKDFKALRFNSFEYLSNFLWRLAGRSYSKSIKARLMILNNDLSSKFDKLLMAISVRHFDISNLIDADHHGNLSPFIVDMIRTYESAVVVPNPFSFLKKSKDGTFFDVHIKSLENSKFRVEFNSDLRGCFRFSFPILYEVCFNLQVAYSSKYALIQVDTSCNFIVNDSSEYFAVIRDLDGAKYLDFVFNFSDVPIGFLFSFVDRPSYVANFLDN